MDLTHLNEVDLTKMSLVDGISISHKKGTDLTILVLKPLKSEKSLLIVIDSNDAYHIHRKLAFEDMPRPNNMALLASFFTAFGVVLDRVEIYAQEEGVYLANLFCRKGRQKVVLDARPSQAVLLALEYEAPIFVSKELVAKYGVDYQQPDEPEDINDLINLFDELESVRIADEMDASKCPKEEDYGQLDEGLPLEGELPLEEIKTLLIKQLEECLQLVIEKEEYEEASKIDKIIKTLKKL